MAKDRLPEAPKAQPQELPGEELAKAIFVRLVTGQQAAVRTAEVLAATALDAAAAFTAEADRRKGKSGDQ